MITAADAERLLSFTNIFKVKGTDSTQSKLIIDDKPWAVCQLQAFRNMIWKSKGCRSAPFTHRLPFISFL